MRFAPVVALLTSAMALAACAGGDASGLGSPGITPVANCPITGVDFNPDNDCIDPGPTPTPAKPDTDGDGIPDDDDKDGGVGSGAGGNDTSLTPATGTRTIVLKSGVYDTPTTAGTTALAAITSGTLTADQTRDAILSPTAKPKTLKIRVDTESSSNAQLSIPIEMKEWVPGTRDLLWIARGHSTEEPDAIAAQMSDINLNPIEWVYGKGFLHLVDDPSGRFHAGDPIDLKDDYYWNQLTLFMSDRANGGAGADYREYNIINSDPDVKRDELLQVWAYDNSYVAMYENAIGTGTPKQQAFTFGGRKATNVPTAGQATYKGRFVGTAKSSSWETPDGSNIDPNADWRVQGSSLLNVDFDRSRITGLMTPESWSSAQDKVDKVNWYTWNTTAADQTGVVGDDYGSVVDNNPGATATCNATTCPDYTAIYGSKVAVSGTIAADGTFNGTATLTNNATEYTTDDSAFRGGFFDTNAGEVAGVFSASGSAPTPNGGSGGITGPNERGNLTITGGFQGDCQVATGLVCTP